DPRVRESPFSSSPPPAKAVRAALPVRARFLVRRGSNDDFGAEICDLLLQRTAEVALDEGEEALAVLRDDEVARAPAVRAYGRRDPGAAGDLPVPLASAESAGSVQVMGIHRFLPGERGGGSPPPR